MPLTINNHFIRPTVGLEVSGHQFQIIAATLLGRIDSIHHRQPMQPVLQPVLLLIQAARQTTDDPNSTVRKKIQGLQPPITRKWYYIYLESSVVLWESPILKSMLSPSLYPNLRLNSALPSCKFVSSKPISLLHRLTSWASMFSAYDLWNTHPEWASIRT